MKKTVVTLLTAAMIAAASVTPAFAATQSIDIEKDLTVQDTHAVPDKDFTFTLTPDSTQNTGVLNGYTKYPGVAVATPTVTINLKDQTIEGTAAKGDENAVTKTLEKAYDFSQVTYTAPGVYRYTLTENAGADTDIYTYDANTYYVDVYVGYLEDKQTLNVEDVILYKNSTTSDKISDIVFANTYKTEELTVKKTVKGNQADYSKEFDFTTTITDDSKTMINGASPIHAEIYNADGSKASDLNNAGTDATSGTVTFNYKLKDGQYIVFCGIPSGTKYTVTEASYTTDGYTTEVTDSDNGVMNSDNAANGATVEVTNTRSATPPTGIATMAAPFGLAALVGAGAVIATKAKKKKED